MANAVYPKAKESFLSQNPSIDLDTDDIRVALVKSGQAYTSTNQYLGDLTGSNIVARSGALTGKSITNGAFNFSSVTYTTPAADTYIFVVYKYNASDASAPLIAYIDTGTNIPATTSGGDVIFQTDGVKLFAL